MKKGINRQSELFDQVVDIIITARKSVVRSTNTTMVTTYYLIGMRIVELEQLGKIRAQYAKNILPLLSLQLKKQFGKGFSVDNLENMRKFYLVYSISENRFRKLNNDKFTYPSFTLGWSHYLILCKIKEESERKFYELEATSNDWNLEELKRQINSSLYERIAVSKNKKKVIELSKKGQIIKEPKDIVKNPYILEFLGLEEKIVYSETDLETAIINQIEKFMLELGKGFFFGGRQVRFTFDEKHFFIDLVFYNRLLKCFVIIDLKIGELEHSDLGQMQMYVNHYDRNVKQKAEFPTIGIIICKSKSDAVVEITLPKNQKQIFASQYKLYLPSKAALKRLVDKK